MATNVGTDLAMTLAEGELDLDVTLRIERDPRKILLLAAARRLSTPRGKLRRHPTYGLDLRALVNASLTPADVRRLQSACAAQIEQDERIARARVALTFDRATERIRVRVTLEAQEGETFSGVLSVSDVTVELLNEAA
jgi:phage baseplate assembly protein W